jgi:hypothetical protein
LQWKNVDIDKRLSFSGICSSVPGGRIRKEGLKTQSFRRFKINYQLHQILEETKPLSFNGDGLVFPAAEGGFIVQDNFRKRVWKKSWKV